MCHMSRGRVTIVELARELGLSKTTVSDALNGAGRVSPETVEAVRSAAERLGYRANRAARSLRTPTITAVGLHLPNHARHLSFYMDFTFGVVGEAAEHGADLTLLTRTPTPDRGYDISGAVLIDVLDDDPVLAALRAAAIPIVLVGQAGDVSAAAATIDAPYSRITTEALDAVAGRGRRRPALLAVDESFDVAWTRDSTSAYRAWCADADIAAVVRQIPTDASEAVLSDAIENVLADGSDAIVCAAQGHSARCQAILRAMGRTVPNAVDVVALAADSVTELGNDRLTVVDRRPGHYGRAATTLLFEVLTGGAVGTHVTFDDWTIRVATPE